MTIILLLIAILILAYQYQQLEDNPATQDILSIIMGLLLLVLIHVLGTVLLTL